MQVTLEEAKAILDFVNLIATVAISTYLDGEQAHLTLSRHRTTAKKWKAKGLFYKPSKSPAYIELTNKKAQ